MLEAIAASRTPRPALRDVVIGIEASHESPLAAAFAKRALAAGAAVVEGAAAHDSRRPESLAGLRRRPRRRAQSTVLTGAGGGAQQHVALAAAGAHVIVAFPALDDAPVGFAGLPGDRGRRRLAAARRARRRLRPRVRTRRADELWALVLAVLARRGDRGRGAGLARVRARAPRDEHVSVELAGYQRGDGRWGFRNHVLVLSAARRGVRGGRAGREPASRRRRRRATTGRGTEPSSTASASSGCCSASRPTPTSPRRVLIGLDDSAAALAAAAASGRTASSSSRSPAAAAARARVRAVEPLVARLVAAAARQAARPAPVEAICLALECGGSDALSGITANPALGIASDLLVAAGGTSILAETSELIGAEHLLARRAVTPEVGAAPCSR